MAEKDTLQNRNSLLEKVVQVRSANDKSAHSQVCCWVILSISLVFAGSGHSGMRPVPAQLTLKHREGDIES